jgi:beta-aspartyl-peptidase (threonine type)
MSDRMAYSGWSLERATQEGIDAVTALGGTTGVVAVDRQGHVAMPYGGHGMYRGVARDREQPVVSIYDK